MPCPIKCLPNIAKYDPNFLTLIQCLTKIICNINKLINSRITFSLIKDIGLKAQILNDFFCIQSDLDDTNILTPNIFLRQQGSLGHIVITENEVEDIPKFLDISKAL
jgi:hypothetical protein